MKISSHHILSLLLVILLLVNVLLLWQNLELKTALNNYAPRLAQKGEFLIDFEAKDLNDVPVNIVFNDTSQKHILFFFRTDCSFCDAQMDLWKELHKQITPDKYRIVAVTPEVDSETIRSFIKKHSVEYWQVVKIKSSDAIGANLNATPITAIVNQDRLVEESWSGRWSTEQIGLINEYFSIDLTGS